MSGGGGRQASPVPAVECIRIIQLVCHDLPAQSTLCIPHAWQPLRQLFSHRLLQTSPYDLSPNSAASITGIASPSLPLIQTVSHTLYFLCGDVQCFTSTL